jgi:hypothetical protein
MMCALFGLWCAVQINLASPPDYGTCIQALDEQGRRVSTRVCVRQLEDGTLVDNGHSCQIAPEGRACHE